MIIHGNGANMHLIKNNEADFIITSPPYFSDESELDLMKPLKKQTEIDRLEKDIVNFALKLKPVFKEIKRILKPGGALVIQTKDLRYGGFIIPLVDLHCDLVRQSGFRLVGRTAWLPKTVHPKLKLRIDALNVSSGFRTLDTEIFLTLTTPDGLKTKKSARELESELEKTDKIKVKEIMDPLWSTGRGRQIKANHRHASPIPPVKRFISLFSKEDDLVVDPFSGGGTNLWIAKNMNRRIIGYEIDFDSVLEAKKLLKLNF
jgi:DNA modification methylase